MLSLKYKGYLLEEIPEEFILKRYGNQEGSFLLLTDYSRLWIDPTDNRCLMVIGNY